VNKQEFVESLAERCELSKAEARRVLDAILHSLTEVMANAEDVRFTGFGTFSSQRRRARETVNPQDPKQKIRIRAANVPKFKPGTSLREATSQAQTDQRPEASESSAPMRDTAAARQPGEPRDWVPLGLRK
jgi:DNA-binding protein HU-beta